MYKNFSTLVLLFLFLSSAYSQLTPPGQKYALRFDGNSIALAPKSTVLNLTGSFTIELWVYVDSYSPYAVIIGKPNDPRGTDPYMSYVIEVGSTDNFEFVQSTGITGSYRGATATTKIALHKWTHLAAVLSNNQMKLYINGLLAGTGISQGPSKNTTVPFTLGAGADANGNIAAGGFAGSVMQARVWNYALSAFEIQSYASKSLINTETGLISNWPLNEGAGNTVVCSNNNALNVTLGTPGNSNKPKWIEKTKIDSLNLFFQAVHLTAPTSMRTVMDMIPFDYNGDGHMDILLLDHMDPATLPGTAMPIVIFKNDGKGNFTNVDQPWVKAIKFVHPRHWTIADFDNNGRKDIVIVDHGTDISPFPGDQSRFLRSMPDGTLAEETSLRLPKVNAFTHNVASADIDKDGDIDMYMCNIQGGVVPSPRIYLNDGTGKLTENQSRLPTIITAFQRKYTASAFADIDNDGDPDLILGGHNGTYVNEFFPKDAILLNDGKGFFSFAPDVAMPNRTFGAAGGTVAITPVDFNSDGWTDLLMATLNQDYTQGSLQLLANNGNGTFRDVSAGITQQWPISASFGNSWIKWNYVADFNNDGLLDFLTVGQNDSPIKLYLNLGNFKFKEITDFTGLYSGLLNAVVGDFNEDGLVDIVSMKYDKSGVFLKNIKVFEVSAKLPNAIPDLNPNPIDLSIVPTVFSQNTTIRFSVPGNEMLTLKIYDILGKSVATLLDQKYVSGEQEVKFDAQNLLPGLYFARMIYGSHIQVKKMMLIK